MRVWWRPDGLDELLGRTGGARAASPGWTVADLRDAVRGRTAPIKAVLLDQQSSPESATSTPTRRCGRPASTRERLAGRCGPAEVKRLHAAVIAVLERGIAAQGASIRDYRGVDGQAGSMQERFDAYDREGEPCPAAAARSGRFASRSAEHTTAHTAPARPAGRLQTWGGRYKTEAVVLRSIRFSEADRVLHLFTPSAAG